MLSSTSRLPTLRYGRAPDGVPIEKIVQGGDTERLRFLLNEYPDYLLGSEQRRLVGVADLCCASTLHLAIEASQLEAARIIVEKAVECFREGNVDFVAPGMPPSPKLINESGGACGTPLDYALTRGGPQGIVGVFYELRSYLRNRYDWLEAAVATDDADLLEQLVANGEASAPQVLEAALAAGAADSIRRFSKTPSVAEAEVVRTFEEALGRRDFGTAALLLDVFYSRLNVPQRESILQTALQSPHDIFQWLLEARIDVWSAGDALLMAAKAQEPEKARLLAQRATEEDSARALGHALALFRTERSETMAEVVAAIAQNLAIQSHGEEETVLLFLAALDAKAWALAARIAPRLEVDGTDSDCRSLLVHAIRPGAAPILSSLLDGGWSLTPVLNERQTFLHLASSCRDPDLVRVLLHHGSNPAARDRHGRTALHEACRTGDGDSARLLADPDLALAPDNRGWTPVAEALRNGHAPIAQAAFGWKTPLDCDPDCVGWSIALEADLRRRAITSSRLFLLVSPESLLSVGKLAFPELADTTAARDHFVRAVVTVYRKGQGFGERSSGGCPPSISYAALSALAAVESEGRGNALHGAMREILGDERYHNESHREPREALREWVKADLGTQLAWPGAGAPINVGPPIYHALWRQNELESLYGLLADSDQLPDLENRPRLRALIFGCADRLPPRAQDRLASGDEARTEAMVESAAEWLRTYEPPIAEASGERTRVIWGHLSFRWDHRRERADWTWRIPYRDGDPDEIEVDGKTLFPFGDAFWLDYRSDPESTSDPAGYRLERPRGAPISFCINGGVYVSGLLAVGAMGAVLTPIDQLQIVVRGLEGAIDRTPEIREVGEHRLVGPFRLTAPLANACGVEIRSEMRVTVASGLEIPGEPDTFLSGLSVALRIVGLPPGTTLQWESKAGGLPARVLEEDEGLRVEVPSTSPGKWELVGAGLRRTVRIRNAVYARPSLKVERRHLVMAPRGLWTVVGARLGERVTLDGVRKRRVKECPFAPVWLVGDEVRPCRRDLPAPAGEATEGDPGAWRAAFRTSLQPKPLYQSKSKTKEAWERYKRA